MMAGTTIVLVTIGIEAGSIAVGLTGGTLAAPARTRLSRWTDIATAPTVVGVTAGVDARSIAVGLTGGTNTLAVRAGLTR